LKIPARGGNACEGLRDRIPSEAEMFLIFEALLIFFVIFIEFSEFFHLF